MKDGRMIVLCVVAVAAAMTVEAQAEFVLEHDDYLTVDTSHTTGALYDNSIASVVQGGRVDYLFARASSTANITGGSVGMLYAHDTSMVNTTGGSVSGLGAYATSTVDITGGSVGSLVAHDTSTANITSGWVETLYAHETSTVNMSGNGVSWLNAYDSSMVSISGGTVRSLHAYDTSTITVLGKDFVLGSGLWLRGNEVFGTGTLSGQWLAGTHWTMGIWGNDETATILLIPEPATLLLFGLGGLTLRRKTRR